MQYIRVRNWDKFQHYKDRRPPWIKLYSGLLDNYEYMQLTLEQRGCLMNLWILASACENKIPYDAKWIAAKLMCSKVDLKPLIESQFLEVIENKHDTDASNSMEQHASNMLATCLQYAIPETETETETYTDTDSMQVDAIASPPAAQHPNDPIVFSMPLKTGKEFPVRESKILEWTGVFRGIDIRREIHRACQWARDNPSKRKTESGAYRFFHSWLSRCKGGDEQQDIDLDEDVQIEQPIRFGGIN